MKIRKATLEDLATILHHRREMFLEMGLGTDAGVELLSEQFFAKALAEGNYHGWLCEEGSEIAAGGGLVLIEYHPSPTNPRSRRPWVVNMYTSARWRNRGFARQIMEAIIDWTRTEGYPNLFLHASVFGRPLYESLGFQPTNEMILRLK